MPIIKLAHGTSHMPSEHRTYGSSNYLSNNEKLVTWKLINRLVKKKKVMLPENTDFQDKNGNRPLALCFPGLCVTRLKLAPWGRHCYELYLQFICPEYSQPNVTSLHFFPSHFYLTPYSNPLLCYSTSLAPKTYTMWLHWSLHMKKSLLSDFIKKQ